jgi:hypothetical protein
MYWLYTPYKVSRRERFWAMIDGISGFFGTNLAAPPQFEHVGWNSKYKELFSPIVYFGFIFADEKDDNDYYWAALFRNNGRGFPRYTPFYSLPFSKAQLAMNRHFTGNGAPLNTISKIRGWKMFAPFPVTVFSKWTPRIIYDKLFLSHTIKFTFPGDHQQTSAFLAGSHCLHICGHLHQEAICPDNPMPVMETLQECRNQLGYCRLCPTDYEITVRSSKNWIRRTTHVNITSFMQVGSCRSTQDWNWVLCSTGWRQLRTSGLATREARGIPSGEIRDTWNRDQEKEPPSLGQRITIWSRELVAHLEGVANL